MTELFIDGQLAVLPEKFSCKKVSENPFFTKSGDYTLDITLSLLNPVNAKIYKHINRLQSVSRFEKRTAILISDNYVAIKGTEIILNHTHETVDIQIAAGNSSLNYLIGNDLKLRDLNMGNAVINVNEIENNLSLPYPHNNWLLLPFYDPDLDFVGNRYTYVAEGNGRLRLKYAYDGVTALFDEGYYSIRYGVIYGKGIQYEDYRPQPYYCFIIKRILESLGYEVVENAIAAHNVFKFAYIVHSQKTLEFAKMLPDWTVEKFFEEIESLFDCTLVVDNDDVSVRLLFNQNFYSSFEENTLVALDDFEVEHDEDTDQMSYGKNRQYNLPDNDYYLYQNLPLDYFTTNGGVNGSVTVGVTVRDTIKNLALYITGSAFATIRKHTFATHWIVNSLRFIDYEEDGSLFPKVVNDYEPLMKNADSESYDESHDIIPAEFSVQKFYIRKHDSIDKSFYAYWQLPVAVFEDNPKIEPIDDDNTTTLLRVQNLVEADSEETSESSSYTKLSLAFYNGSFFDLVESAQPSFQYDALPISFVRSISERMNKNTTDFIYIFGQNGDYRNYMSFGYLYDELYSKNLKIDKSKIYKIRFLAPVNKMVDPKGVFIIDNKKFYCRKIESTITNDGFEEIFEGEFYAES